MQQLTSSLIIASSVFHLYLVRLDGLHELRIQIVRSDPSDGV